MNFLFKERVLDGVQIPHGKGQFDGLTDCQKIGTVMHSDHLNPTNC